VDEAGVLGPDAVQAAAAYEDEIRRLRDELEEVRAGREEWAESELEKINEALENEIESLKNQKGGSSTVMLKRNAVLAAQVDEMKEALAEFDEWHTEGTGISPAQLLQANSALAREVEQLKNQLTRVLAGRGVQGDDAVEVARDDSLAVTTIAGVNDVEIDFDSKEEGGIDKVGREDEHTKPCHVYITL
jgi:ElaB/YqjD/DUF883 family membrane-anchored ribosome-binding protein